MLTSLGSRYCVPSHFLDDEQLLLQCNKGKGRKWIQCSTVLLVFSMKRLKFFCYYLKCWKTRNYLCDQWPEKRTSQAYLVMQSLKANHTPDPILAPTDWEYLFFGGVMFYDGLPASHLSICYTAPSYSALNFRNPLLPPLPLVSVQSPALHLDVSYLCHLNKGAKHRSWWCLSVCMCVYAHACTCVSVHVFVGVLRGPRPQTPWRWSYRQLWVIHPGTQVLCESGASLNLSTFYWCTLKAKSSNLLPFLYSLQSCFPPHLEIVSPQRPTYTCIYTWDLSLTTYPSSAGP